MKVRISQFSIKRPIFTLVTMFLVLILGIVSVINIPMKLIPDINPPVGVVVASYPGASSEEVAQKVTKPLEESLSTLPGLKTMTSSSQESANFILLQFSWTTDIDEIQNDIIQRLDQARMPEGADRPRFMKFDPSQFPIIQLSLHSDTEEETLRNIATQLKNDLARVPGVASVNLSGTAVKEIRVELDQDQLKEYQLSQEDIVNVIQANQISLPGDTVLTGDKELTTRVISTIDSLDTLKKLTVTIDPFTGEEILLQDISKVQMQKEDDRTITRANQKPSVLLSVLQQSDANTAEVSNEFKRHLDGLLEQEKYKNIAYDILFDQGDFIGLAISNISTSLILGGLFAMIVLFLFLKNVRSPLIIGISIPYSVIFTFVLMYFSDFTLNIMTLGGLALGIGMLVDNSIVVIENIYRHLSMGKDSKKAAIEGAMEVGAAITASTLTTVAVFLPVVFISGIIGQLFTEFALTISFSLFASLIVALTVVPMLASRLLKAPGKNLEAKRQASPYMRSLEGAVKWSLKNRAIVLLISLILLGGGGYALSNAGTEFLPNTDEGFFTMKVKLQNGTALSETNRVITSLENELKDEKDIETYVSLIGTTQEGSFRGSKDANIAEVYVKMKELNERGRSTFEFVDDVKKRLESAVREADPNAELTFSLQSSSGTSPNTLTFSVQNTDKKSLNRDVEKISDTLKTIDDVTELSSDLSEKIEEIQITVDRKRALENGLAPGQIAMAVNDVTRGNRAAQMIDENANIYGVFVEYDPEVTQNLEKLKTMLLKKPDGSYIALADVTDIRVGEGPVSIQRINQENAVQFTLKYKAATNMGAISKKVDKKIEELHLRDETKIVFSGDRELLESSIDEMIMAFVLAIIFVYLVMAAQFESLKYPFVIMFTVPLMIIGVAIALRVTNTPIGITAIIGIIVLAGIVVNNAIVIVDYINQRKEQGIQTYEAIVTSVKDRVRPILMTALTTILGLIPIALGIGEGSELNQPMGIAVIGGLFSSTFLTLFVIPVVYSLFDKDTRSLKEKA
jgi:hydrophobic/amphiphilic exporter-1 (mainly G- bacteria), HAE1 family